MNTIEAIYARYTCRGFKPDPVSVETLRKILAAATRAPSCGNTQPWEIYVACGDVLERLREALLLEFKKGTPGNPDIPSPEPWSPKLKARYADCGADRLAFLNIARDDVATRAALKENNYRFFGAPAVAYLCADKGVSTWSLMDLGMMTQGLMVAAQDRRVNSGISMNFIIYPDIVRAALDIPNSVMIATAVALGYADENVRYNKYRSKRLPLDEVAHFRGI